MKPLISILLGCLACLAAAAQDRAFDFYASNLLILQARPIQKEIGVTDAQRKRMNDFANADRPRRTAILQQFQREAEAAQKAGRRYEPDYAKIRTLDQALKQNVLAILSDAQLRRLREITIQSSGLVALLDERVAQEAGAPKATVQKLRVAFTSGAKKAEIAKMTIQKRLYDEYSKKKPKNDAEARKLQQEAIQRLNREAGPVLDRIQKQTRAQMEAMLSGSQKAGLKRLAGKPFKA